jgi:hypothetical protein
VAHIEALQHERALGGVGQGHAAHVAHLQMAGWVAGWLGEAMPLPQQLLHQCRAVLAHACGLCRAGQA